MTPPVRASAARSGSREAGREPWLHAPPETAMDEHTAPALAGALREHGLLVMPRSVDPLACDELRTCALCQLQRARKQGRKSEFGLIRAAYRRSELLLQPHPATLRVLTAALGRCGGVVAEALGPGAALCELSAIVSEPGSHDQPIHSDTSLLSRDRLITVFIALTSAAHGPTVVYPRTHTTQFHCQVAASSQEAALAGRDGVLMDVEAGSIYLMDSGCFHGGTANDSKDQVRIVMVATFASAGQRPSGPTYALRPELNGVTLEDLVGGRTG